MRSNRSLLEHVLIAYREGDMDECIRLVRTLVDAAPLATAPRQLLASLYAQTGKGRLALGHYRKLLSTTVVRGEVLRSIAFQKQIDAFQPPESHAPDRWGALQTQLRAHGIPYLVAAPGGTGRPWTEVQLLALPRTWFERIAAETRFEFVGFEPQTMEIEAGTVWEVLAGRMRWSFALPDGRTSAELLAVQGNAIHIDPALAPHARLTLVPELPVESLRFDAALAREIRAALAEVLTVPGAVADDLTSETRARLPSAPRRREALDEASRVPTPAAESTPLRLAARAEGAASPEPPPRDSGDWLEFGLVSLGGAPGGPAGEGEARATRVGPDESHPSPAADAPAPPLERGEELIPPADDEPNEASLDERGQPSERRRHPRVAVSYESRIALLKMMGAGVAPIHGRLTDLSTSGLRVRFAQGALGASRGALADAVVAVDLDLSGPQGPLRLAGQVRWVDAEPEPNGDEARIGIEFVLLTEPDRRRLAGTLARAALNAGYVARPAA